MVRELEAREQVDLTTIPKLAAGAMSSIVQESVQGWDEEVLDVFGTRIVFPLLRLDHAALGRSKRALLR